MKSAVSILYEYLSKMGLKAVYELRSERVTRRAVLFYYRVKVGDLQATATGYSKKQAKQNASEKMLDTLYQCPRLFQPILQNEQIYTKCSDDMIKLHPIQSLYDICMSNHWYIPTYEYTIQEGPSHNKTFTCVARVNNVEEKAIGIGKSKKLSKANAAYALVKKLSESNGNYCTHMVSHPYINYTMVLQNIASSNELELSYFHFPDKGKSANKQCLLRISSNPVIICCGTGETRDDALNEASMNAIDSLRITHGVLRKCFQLMNRGSRYPFIVN